MNLDIFMANLKWSKLSLDITQTDTWFDRVKSSVKNQGFEDFAWVFRL